MASLKHGKVTKPAPRRRSAEAKALALKHFRQRKLPRKKPDEVPAMTADEWDFYFPEDEGNDGY